MKKLSARIYDGDTACFIEDSYGGRTYHLPLFKIRLDEIDFVSGRFIMYNKHTVYENLVYASNIEDYDGEYHIERYVEWISDNYDSLKGKWNITNNSIQWLFNFEYKEDAMLFKMVNL